MPTTRSRAWEFLVVGSLATFAAGGLTWLTARLGIFGAKPLAEMLLALTLLHFYPEHNERPWSIRLVAALIGLALALVFVWIVVFAWGKVRFVDVSALEPGTIILTLISAVITAPIFEEKVVRGLLAQGLASFTTPLTSAALVSLVFALTHDGAMLWSFMVSMLFCALVFRWRLNVFQRSLTHGLLNLMILLWYGTNGYGISPWV